MYGKELIIDIHNCDSSKFNRTDIEKYLIELCENIIDMERAVLYWWDYEGEPEEYASAPDHLKGVSCVQFITTSTITIHALDALEKIFINIFSCKDFNKNSAREFTEKYFNGTIQHCTEVNRI